MIDKLNLMSRELMLSFVTGKDAIPPEKLVLGDLMLLSLGEQILKWCWSHVGIADANESYADWWEWLS